MNQSEKESPGEEKAREYADRINAGEDKTSIYKGLGPAFIAAIESKLDQSGRESGPILAENNTYQIPPQYEGIDPEILEDIWIIPEYVDPAITVSEKDRKSKTISRLKQEKKILLSKEEGRLNDLEAIEGVKINLGLSSEQKINPENDEFSTFTVSNGETDEGAWWYQYRNKEAKRLKQEGKLEWGKERLYFDVSISDMEKLRDLIMKITGDQKIPVAFKFMDEKKTSKLQKDGSETRFVANFATEDDAIKFYKVLRQSPEYADLASDRSLDYHGLRIDNLVEYASGYREQREPIRRIVENAVLNDEGNYEYFKDDRKIILTPEIYENCKSQYQDANEKLNISRQKWQESINKEDNS